MLNGSWADALWRWTVVLLMMAWLLGTGWLASRAALRRVFQGSSFGGALKDAFEDARPHLAFLPVVGRLFAYRRKD